MTFTIDSQLGAALMQLMQAAGDATPPPAGDWQIRRVVRRPPSRTAAALLAPSPQAIRQSAKVGRPSIVAITHDASCSGASYARHLVCECVSSGSTCSPNSRRVSRSLYQTATMR